MISSASGWKIKESEGTTLRFDAQALKAWLDDNDERALQEYDGTNLLIMSEYR